MRADRLVAALLILQARGRVTAAELADELEVSERTARRDLEALGMAGLPIYSQQGRGGGWRLIGYEVPVGRRRVLRGRSWSGTAPIRRVEVSTDGGRRWHPARLDPHADPPPRGGRRPAPQEAPREVSRQ